LSTRLYCPSPAGPPRAGPPPRALTSSLPPSCPCSPWRPARPASPWRCGWPRCWGPRLAGSPAHSAGTQGPASRRSHPPPWVRRCPWLCCCPLLLPPPGQTLAEERDTICSSSVMLLRSVIVIFSKASSESAEPNPCSGTAVVLPAGVQRPTQRLFLLRHVASLGKGTGRGRKRYSALGQLPRRPRPKGLLIPSGA
uniref:Uncharacterized protein n=1 Tax=Strigops habroptila TaxID=2489341 RepID=A0A672UN52_STRHB